MSEFEKALDEWEKAIAPMRTTITDEKKEGLEQLITKPDEASAASKQLKAVKTYTLLDNLFLNQDGTPLGGVPAVAQIGITGLPSSGKSILIEEIAVQVAGNGGKVLLVTSEDSWKSDTDRFDLQSRLKQKADILGLGWDTIKENLIVLDTVSHAELRSWNTFAECYRYSVEHYGVKLALIDSVTLLESYRGALKYRLQELSRWNQEHGVTAIYVNQRATEDWDTRAMAGGIGLGHVLDSTIIIDYGRTYHSQINMDLGTKRGTFVRIVRVLGCRLCRYDGKYHKVKITEDGFLRLEQ